MNPLLLTGIFDVGTKLIDRLFPNQADKDKAKLELLTLQQNGELKVLESEVQLALGQITVNKAEAESTDPFRAGWRPAIGYTLAGSLAFTYLVNPIILWVNVLFQLNVTPPNIMIDDHLWELMLGMLGLAGWRSLDKKNGVDK
jgi:hypothetical protein